MSGAAASATRFGTRRPPSSTRCATPQANADVRPRAPRAGPLALPYGGGMVRRTPPSHLDPAPPRWVAACAWGSLAAALPSALWRIGLAFGDLGTPESWRVAQQIPGEGTAYVIALSVVQIAAAACSVALTVDLARIAPHALPAVVRSHASRAAALAGLAGAAVLAVLVTLTILRWENVDPFAGAAPSIWSAVCSAAYACAVAWPPLLAAASAGRLAQLRRARDR